MSPLTIFHDLTCPFCLVGLRKLEIALGAPLDDMDVTWAPLILDDRVPHGGLPFQDYHRAKYGDRSAGLQRMVEGIGRSVGLDFDFESLERYPPTVGGHAIVLQAATIGRGTLAATALMRAYFLEGADIGDDETLLDIAADVIGIDRALAEAALKSEVLARTVRQESLLARAAGISSVPSYAMDGEQVGGTDAMLVRLSELGMTQQISGGGSNVQAIDR